MLYNLVRAQRQLQEVTVVVVLLNEGRLAQELRDIDIELSILPEAELNLPQLILRVRAILTELLPDIVHTHRIKEDLVGALAAPFTRKVQRVRTVHGMDEATGTSLRLKLSRLVHRICVRRCFARTYAVSQPLEKALGRTFGSDKVRYIANGINVDEDFQFPEKRSTEGSLAIKIGIVGRLVPVKRLDIFLQMAAQLQRHEPDRFVFLIYGDGPEGDRLRRLTEQLGISEMVHFLGFCANIAAGMSGLDLLYITSDSEGLPMVALEAMALGVPVVAHAVGELPVVLDHGRCGTLVEHHDPDSYAAASLQFLEHREDFLEKARLAQARVAKEYSARACAQFYVDDYCRIVQAGTLHSVT